MPDSRVLRRWIRWSARGSRPRAWSCPPRTSSGSPGASRRTPRNARRASRGRPTRRGVATRRVVWRTKTKTFPRRPRKAASRPAGPGPAEATNRAGRLPEDARARPKAGPGMRRTRRGPRREPPRRMQSAPTRAAKSPRVFSSPSNSPSWRCSAARAAASRWRARRSATWRSTPRSLAQETCWRTCPWRRSRWRTGEEAGDARSRGEARRARVPTPTPTRRKNRVSLCSARVTPPARSGRARRRRCSSSRWRLTRRFCWTSGAFSCLLWREEAASPPRTSCPTTCASCPASPFFCRRAKCSSCTRRGASSPTARAAESTSSTAAAARS